MDGSDSSQLPPSATQQQSLREPSRCRIRGSEANYFFPNLSQSHSTSAPLKKIPEPLDSIAWPPPLTSVDYELSLMQAQYGHYAHTDNSFSEYAPQENAGHDSIQSGELLYSPTETLSASSHASRSIHTTNIASFFIPDNHDDHSEQQQLRQYHQFCQQQPNSQWASTDRAVPTSVENRPIAPKRTSTESEIPATSQGPPPQPVLMKRQGKEGNREYRRVKAKCHRVKNKNRDEGLLKLEEELLQQNEELSTQADELKGEVLGLKNEILSHAWCDDQIITQYINNQAAHLNQRKSSQVFTAESGPIDLDATGHDGDTTG